MGWAAEGKFWALNNMIAASDGGILDLNDEIKRVSIAVDLDFELPEFDEFIQFLIKSCRLLVDVDGKVSNGIVQETLEEVNSKRERQRNWKKEKSVSKLEESTHKIQKSTSTNGKSIVENEQSKLNKNKVNKSKVVIGAPAVPTAKRVFNVPEKDEIRSYFKTLIGDSTKPGSWPEDKCNLEADSLLDHYTANGWSQGRGKPIKDWKAACRNWIRNALKGNFSPVSGNNSAISGNKIQKSETIVQKIDTPVQQIDKTAREINYLFSRYMENPEHCTTISVETVQYDYLKQKGMIKFSQEKTEQIRSAAHTAIAEKGIQLDEIREKIFMKKIAVIEFFKDFQASGKEAIFS
jgi:hypothetical protein